jgi:hypothetical protein
LGAVRNGEGADGGYGSVRDTNLRGLNGRTEWKNLLEDRTPTAGMPQADAPVGGLRIAMATGVPRQPAVKAAAGHLSTGPKGSFAAWHDCKRLKLKS